MKFQQEYRDPARIKNLAEAIGNITRNAWTIMEVCGGQTHAIVRYGIDQLLPSGISLVHGPGCPVCVTPVEYIDKAIAIAARPGVIFTSFGDMMRVPGSSTDLLVTKSSGADIRTVYSPMDALEIARKNPDREVVFFAVGFETTAPANAMAVYRAKQLGIKNFFVLVSQVTVPPAIETILTSPENRVQGFLAAGHVCAIMGIEEYIPISARYGVPIIVTGFEPLDILEGIYMCVKQLEDGRAEVENQYARVVSREGNLPAQQIIEDVLMIVPRQWRGIGEIPASGLALKPEYASYNAEVRFGAVTLDHPDSGDCISGSILR
ncbi:MAG: hydrogenase formation protein HypD, partial [Gammaproteobacteria bacterium]|nr:hydrogenase formation protein HypD [Gammaproteobacteria bacterium]